MTNRYDIRIGRFLAAAMFSLSLVMSRGAASPLTSQPAAPAGKPTTQPADPVREELVRKLLGGASTTVDQVDVMLAGMDEAAKRLTENHDVGRQTQTAQRRVLEGLDNLIRQAGDNRQATPQQSRVRPRGQREPPRRRSADDRRPPVDGKGGQAQRGGPGAGGKSDVESKQEVKAQKGELIRGWGYLPGRERDEIIQGFDEEFLAKYREEIMQYYRNLATAGREP